MAQTMICTNCGIETTYGDARINDRYGCEEGDRHDWSDDDPLARLEARISASADLKVANSEDNDGWQWVAVEVESGIGGHLAGWVADEGFSFLCLGYGDDVVRFNRQK